MPIKPENAERYPADWPEIRARILARADNCCEGSPAYPDCRVPNGWYRNNDIEQITQDADGAAIWSNADGQSVTRIVLTIGHLDHTPENCADDNLRAWCQRCHLTYDAKHHAQTAYATRRAGKADGDLFPARSLCHPCDAGPG